MVRLASPACIMPGLYGCCMHTGLAHHVLCRCVYTEVTLADMLIDVAIGEVGPCDELLFQCEWAIVATQTVASTDEPFRHGVAPIALVIE